MKSSAEYIGAILKRGFLSVRFVGIVIAIAVLEIMDVFPVYQDNITNYGTEDLLNLLIMGGYTLFQLVSVSMAVVPFGFVFCEDYENGYLSVLVQKSSSLKYACCNMVACGIGSFVTVLFGEIIMLFVYHMWGVPLFTEEGAGFYIGENGFSLIEQGQYVSLMVAFVLLRCLRGMLFGMLALVLSSVIKNKMVIASVPIILYYFFMHVGFGTLKLPDQCNINIYWQFVFGWHKEWLSIAYVAGMTIGFMLLFIWILDNRVRKHF